MIEYSAELYIDCGGNLVDKNSTVIISSSVLDSMTEYQMDFIHFLIESYNENWEEKYYEACVEINSLKQELSNIKSK